MGIKYKEEEYIQTIKCGQRGYGRYKYRVLDRDDFATHHTNDMNDARRWFKKCVEYWEKVNK